MSQRPCYCAGQCNFRDKRQPHRLNLSYRLVATAAQDRLTMKKSFNVVRNSCKTEKVDLIKSSGKGETYKVRVACDNSGEDADDPEDHRIKHIDLIIHYVITQYNGDEGLIISNPSKVKHR
jgi:hypothetical protein